MMQAFKPGSFFAIECYASLLRIEGVIPNRCQEPRTLHENKRVKKPLSTLRFITTALFNPRNRSIRYASYLSKQTIIATDGIELRKGSIGSS